MRLIVVTLLFAATAVTQPIPQSKSLTLYELPNSLRMQPTTARVRAFIRKLGAVDPAMHTAAERELLSLCPGIEAQLRYAIAEEEKSAPAPLPTPDPLTQEYVRGGQFSRFQPADRLPRGVYHSIEALLVHCDELRHLKPALITLNAHDAPLADVFRQLGEQAGAPVRVVARSFDGPVSPLPLDWFQSARTTIKVDHVAYWVAVRTLLATIHPPAPLGVELFVYVGNNQLQLNPPPFDTADLYRNPNAVSAGPLLLVAEYRASLAPRLTVTAVADPALSGFTGDSSLHLEAVTDKQGNSLLLDGDNTSSSGGLDQKDYDPKFGYAFNYSGGRAAWRQSIPIKALDPGQTVAVIRGTFSIGFGVNESVDKIGIPLAPFHANEPGPKAAEEQIYVLQNCKVLQPPSADKPVYETDHLDCYARGIERSGAAKGHKGRETAEGTTLTLANHRDHAVTYVSSMTYFADAAHGFPKPDQVVEGVGIYHAHAEPGQTVRITMATSYREGSRPRLPGLPDAIPAAARAVKPQTVVFDGWRLNVLSVTRSGEVYEIVGQLALPKGGPFGDTAVGAGYIFLSPLDAQGWQIESYPHFSKLRPESDHLVEDFKVVTREPGRIPADLLWQAPSATHWLSTSFEIRHLDAGDPK